jgi:hypothetical protein
MIARAKNIFGVRICNKDCPKALGIYSPCRPSKSSTLAFSSI